MDNRQIDALVAEKVMKATLQPKQPGATYAWWILPDGKCLGSDGLWSPSKNTSTAIEVLEEIERQFHCRIDIRIRSGPPSRVWNGERWEHKRYAVTISGGEIGYDSFDCSFTVYGDSLCVAACEAALKAEQYNAVGVEVESEEG